DLASALGVSQEELLETAPTGAIDGIAAFVQMVADTGSDDARRTLLDRILADDGCPLACARPLAPRLSAEEVRADLPRMMVPARHASDATWPLAGPNPGAAPLAASPASPGFPEVKSMGGAARDTGAAQPSPAAARTLEAALNRIGLLVDAAAARELAAQLTA